MVGIPLHDRREARAAAVPNGMHMMAAISANHITRPCVSEHRPRTGLQASIGALHNSLNVSRCKSVAAVSLIRRWLPVNFPSKLKCWTSILERSSVQL